MSTEYDRLALLALPSRKNGSAEEAGFMSWSRPNLITMVRERGVDVMGVRGTTAFDSENGLVNGVVRPEYSINLDTVQLQRIGAKTLDNFDVVRNIIAMVPDDETRFLNPNSVRRLARDKYGMIRQVLQPAGVYARTSLQVDPTIDHLADVIADIPGSHVVAKPNAGLRSRGIIVGEKSDVAKRMSESSEPYIIEEKLDFTAPFWMIKGSDQQEQARLNEANRSGVNKELRMYYFGNGEWDAVLRVAAVGETDFRNDNWLHVDLDSIPGSLVEHGMEVAIRVGAITNEDEFHIALDWVYAGSASSPEPSWQVMEVNAAEPQLVQVGEHNEVGLRHHEKLATQIARIAIS